MTCRVMHQSTVTVLHLQNDGLLLVEDGNHGEYRPRTEDFEEKGVAFIRASDMDNGRVLFESAQKINETAMSRIRKGIGKGGDVLLSHKGTIGKVAAVPLDAPPFVCSPQTTFWRSLDNEKIDRRYLAAFMSSQMFKTQLFARQNETDMAGYVSLTAQRTFHVVLPPIETQKAIAHILGTLDDKIELNRQMNATLEAMAQALFKSWFVDFDPVIDNALAAGNSIPEPLQAKAEVRAALGDQRKPLPEAIQKQFPSRFVFSEEMGWIPEGWEVRSIGESFQLLGGHSFKSGEYVEEGQYGVVTIKNVQDGSFIQVCANKITNLPPKMKDHCKLTAGDVLLSLTGNVGRVCIVSEGSYVLNQRVSKIIGLDDIPRSFAYFFFRQSPLYEMMLTTAKGTAQQNLSPIETAKLKQTLPSNRFIVETSVVFEDIFRKIVSNTTQSQALTGLRNTLLPKLLSGELRIPDAEKLVADSV